METVIIVIHLMVIIALVTLVLLQRSEGGALGIGASNNFMTGRTQGNVLTRATGILAAAFFLTSIALTAITQFTAPPSSIIDTTTAAPANTPTTPTTGGTTDTTGTGGSTDQSTGASTSGNGNGILDELNRYTGQTPPTGGGTTSGGTTTTGGGTTTGSGGTTTPPATPEVPTTQ